MFPPMPTPFSAGEVDAAAIRRNVERFVAGGLGGGSSKWRATRCRPIAR